MKNFGCHLLLVLLFLVFGNGSHNLTDAQENWHSNANVEDHAIIEDSFSIQNESNEKAVELGGPSTTGKSFFTGLVNSSPLVIPAAAFRSDGYLPESFLFSFSGAYIHSSTVSTICGMAPVYLQDGIRLDSIWATMYDNSEADNVSVKFRRFNTFGAGQEAEVLATIQTFGQTDKFQIAGMSIIDNSVIESPQYTYYVTTCFKSPKHRLYSLRIYYKVD